MQFSIFQEVFEIENLKLDGIHQAAADAISTFFSKPVLLVQRKGKSMNPYQSCFHVRTINKKIVCFFFDHKIENENTISLLVSFAGEEDELWEIKVTVQNSIVTCRLYETITRDCCRNFSMKIGNYLALQEARNSKTNLKGSDRMRFFAMKAVPLWIKTEKIEVLGSTLAALKFYKTWDVHEIRDLIHHELFPTMVKYDFCFHELSRFTYQVYQSLHYYSLSHPLLTTDTTYLNLSNLENKIFLSC